MIFCPKCGGKMRCTDSRLWDSQKRWRRYNCEWCGLRLHTLEKVLKITTKEDKYDGSESDADV